MKIAVKQKKILAWLMVFSFVVLLFPGIVFGQGENPSNPQPNGANSIREPLKTVAESGGYAPSPKMELVFGKVISAFLSLLGIMFLIYMLYAGYNYMTARGEEDKVHKALATIRQAIIGLVIIVAAYALWAFVFQAILK